MQRIYKLKGVVQPYAWGGSDFIPALTGIKSDGKPAAEYWLGAHPLAPSTVDIEGQPSLLDLIREKPQHFLGKNTAHDSLPFLVKVLDVKEMLSIQVHPTTAQARSGFEKENALGISLTASNRSYKDANQKTEVLFALSDFWLLRGFRSAEAMKAVFTIPELSVFEKDFTEGGYEQLFTRVMRMDQGRVNEILKPLAERVTLLYNQNKLNRSEPDFWAARALQTYFTDGNIDRGIFSVYFLNLVNLRKGQMTGQAPGVLHAYLEGQNAEVMTNSDNVLRAGLTPKHIDVEELLKLVDFSEATAGVAAIATEPVHRSEDFNARMVTGDTQNAWEDTGPAILLVTDGDLLLKTDTAEEMLNKGEAAFVVPGTKVELKGSKDVEYILVTV